MTPERFRQVREVADAALDRPEAERDSFLAAICAGNHSLQAEVESLLEAYEHVRGASFMEIPVAELARSKPLTAGEEEPRDDALPAGTRLGAYEIDDAVGRGGMGIVYRGVRADDEYRQVVAIKVIRRGMDTAVGQRRFREERQILAGLDHPGIARLLDGGSTEEGLPYFVMEYVEGEPIDNYCDRVRLGVTERLRLFLRVCAAVHYAHRSLVVHRDLKPGNVLVTADGIPKLLDFGIARLVRPATEPGALDPTVTALRMLTPDYASPEQVRGEAVTTATDIYSLGVLLYELLTGQRPYRANLVHEVLAAICEQDPERPSAALGRTRQPTTAGPSLERTAEELSGARATTPAVLRRKLAGDLDTIVLKALRKAPTERYASVEAFAEDLTRHLEGQPVQARPHTLAYRAAKFVRRNPTAAVAAALAVAALLGGIVTTTRQARIAEANRARAEQRFADVRSLADFVMFDMHDAIEKLPGSTRARKQLVERALQYLDRLIGEGVTDPVLLGEISRGYARLAEVQGQPNNANLGDRAGGLASARKALSAQERVAAALPLDGSASVALARRHLELASLLEEKEARLPLAQAESILRALPDAERNSTDALAVWETYYYVRASAEQDAGDMTAQREARRRELEIAEALLARDRASAMRQRSVAVACKYYGGVLHRANEYAEARRLYDRAVELDQGLLAAEPSNPQTKLDLSFSLASVASLLRDQGHLTDALRSYQEAQTLRENVFAADPDNGFAFHVVARGHESLASVLASMGDVDAALGQHRQALRLRQEREKKSPSRYGNAGWEASFHESAGDVLAKAAAVVQSPGRRKAYWGRARDEYSRALALWEQLAAAKPLEGAAAGAPQRLQECIAECTQALARL
jgi:eukaryotic-like serine/threonine-protein kinase